MAWAAEGPGGRKTLVIPAPETMRECPSTLSAVDGEGGEFSLFRSACSPDRQAAGWDARGIPPSRRRIRLRFGSASHVGGLIPTIQQ